MSVSSVLSIDWLFTALGMIIGLFGLVLLIRALWWDRPRGRRRCPRCWYDMTLAPGLTCSECGHDAHRQRRLLKTRRHWRAAMVAIIILIVAWTTLVTPRMQRNGWSGFVPTTLIVLGLSLIEEYEHTDWGQALLSELADRRLTVNSRDHCTGWDWQWSIASKHAINWFEERRFNPQPRWMPRMPRIMPTAGTHYWNLLTAATRSGQIHRAGLVDRARAISPPVMQFVSASEWPNDAPLLAKLEFDGGYFDAIPISFRALDLDSNRDLPCRVAHPPIRSWRPTGASDVFVMITVPPDLRDGGRMSLQVSCDFGLCRWPQPNVDYCLPWGTLTRDILIEHTGPLAEVVSPAQDSELEKRIRNGTVWRVIRHEASRGVRIEAEFGGLTSHDPFQMGRIVRLELLKDERVVYSTAQTIKSVSTMPRALEGVAAREPASPQIRPYSSQAPLEQPRVLSPFVSMIRMKLSDAESNSGSPRASISLPALKDRFSMRTDPAAPDWRIRLRVDPLDIFLWTDERTYWRGTLEVPLDPVELLHRQDHSWYLEAPANVNHP